MKAKVDIDWMDKEQYDAHLDNHIESKGYHTIKKGEEIPKTAIHFTGRPLIEILLEGNPHWVETENSLPEEEKIIKKAKSKKEREIELYAMTKLDQINIIGKLGGTESPRTESGRVELILKLESY